MPPRARACARLSPERKYAMNGQCSVVRSYGVAVWDGWGEDGVRVRFGEGGIDMVCSWPCQGGYGVAWWALGCMLVDPRAHLNHHVLLCAIRMERVRLMWLGYGIVMPPRLKK